MAAKVRECFAKILDMVLPPLASDNDIINIRGDIPSQLISQYLLDHSIESASCVAEALRHSHVAICPERGGEAGLLFVRLVHEYLVIT